MPALKGVPARPRQRLTKKTSVQSALGIAQATRCPSADAAAAGGFRFKARHPEYLVLREALDADMMRRLLAFLKRKRPRAAKMKNEGGDSDDERKARYDDRDSMVSWFHCEEECRWLHERFTQVIRDVANLEWPMLRVLPSGELDCEYEKTQYTVYGPKQHFQAWHQDAFESGHDQEDARQFTIVAMLTGKHEYTGGHFQVKLPPPSGQKGRKLIRSLKLDLGDILVFPAKRLVHRVTPVKSGIRKTLVFWASDPLSCIHGREEALQLQVRLLGELQRRGVDAAAASAGEEAAKAAEAAAV